MIHPQAQAVLDALDGGAEGTSDLAAARAGYLQTALRFGGAKEVVGSIEDAVTGGVGLRVYEPHIGALEGTVVYFHGGGWIAGDLDGIDGVCRSLCNAAGARVASVDYRLAPEHPFPDAVDDAVLAVDWALACDDAVVVAGDSAGGQLAAIAALARRDVVRGQAVVYPALDPACHSASYGSDAPGLTAEQMRACWSAYLAGADPASPDVSPLRADLHGAPPAFVAVAGHDVLRDDGVRYAERLRAAGVELELVEFEDMVHGFLRWGGMVDRAQELIAQLGAFVRRRVAA